MWPSAKSYPRGPVEVHLLTQSLLEALCLGSEFRSKLLPLLMQSLLEALLLLTQSLLEVLCLSWTERNSELLWYKMQWSSHGRY